MTQMTIRWNLPECWYWLPATSEGQQALMTELAASRPIADVQAEWTAVQQFVGQAPSGRAWFVVALPDSNGPAIRAAGWVRMPCPPVNLSEIAERTRHEPLAPSELSRRTESWAGAAESAALTIHRLSAAGDTADGMRIFEAVRAVGVMAGEPFEFELGTSDLLLFEDMQASVHTVLDSVEVGDFS